MLQLRGSIPHSGRSTSGVDKRRRQKRWPDGRRGSSGGGAFVVNVGPIRMVSNGYRVTPKFSYYPEKSEWPTFVQRKGCQAPISEDCMTLQVSPRWAMACFKPRYYELRLMYRDDLQAIVDDLLALEVPNCNVGKASTGAEHELRRRVTLAVAALMNAEGVPVRYPSKAVFPRPTKALYIKQVWVRALLTGHL